MATTTGSHGVASFTSPINSTSPIDANSVRNNDNALRSAYVNHDADTGIHVQSSDLASRPVASIAGRKWMTVDTGVSRLWFDTGSQWVEVSAAGLSTAQTIALTGDVTGSVSSDLSSGASISTAIAAGVIVNADINANAEIAVSKLADGAARQLLQTDTAGTGVEWTSNVDVPGTLDVTGATTLDAGLTVDGTTFVVDAANDRVGIGTASPAYPAQVYNGQATGYGLAVGNGTSGTAGDFAGLLMHTSGSATAPLYNGAIRMQITASAPNFQNPAMVFLVQNSGTSGLADLTERARITAGGNFECAGVYSATVGGTNRDVYVDNTGLLGYVSSIRAAKTNIEPLIDTDWLLDLEPVAFNYRKKDENGAYTDEVDGIVEYGLIAEDTEPVKPELCFYDIVDGEPELRGINYSKLIVPMLKLIQTQQSRIEALEARLAALEGAA